MIKTMFNVDRTTTIQDSLYMTEELVKYSKLFSHSEIAPCKSIAFFMTPVNVSSTTHPVEYPVSWNHTGLSVGNCGCSGNVVLAGRGERIVNEIGN